MFWGLIVEPQRRYSQTVKKAFHISMAALDESTSDDSPTQVICSYDDRNYLLCTLQKGNTIQVPLDLNYEIGDKISFATNGKAHVHLTGYLLEEQFSLEDCEEEEEDEDEIVKSSTSKRRQKKDPVSCPPKKKSKTLELLNAVNSNDEDDSDDSDVNMSDLMDEEDNTFDTTHMEEEEDEEDDEKEEGDEEEDEDESEDDEEEVEGEESDGEPPNLFWAGKTDLAKQTKKVMENGVAGKKQKKKLEKAPQQQQQQQKGKKQKKDKPVKSDKTPAKGDKTPVKPEKTPGKTEETTVKADKTPSKGDGKAANKSPKQEGGSPQKRTIEGGVVIEDLKIGNGPAAKPGKFVKVYYEGRFKNNNKMFDSTTKGPGFEFRLGRQEVIKGWDVGLAGMKVGGKRRIICSPNMAYGQKGFPPTIPPNSTLIFDVELKNVK